MPFVGYKTHYMLIMWINTAAQYSWQVVYIIKLTALFLRCFSVWQHLPFYLKGVRALVDCLTPQAPFKGNTNRTENVSVLNALHYLYIYNIYIYIIWILTLWNYLNKIVRIDIFPTFDLSFYMMYWNIPQKPKKVGLKKKDCHLFPSD